jgi:hypothetical protein
MSQHPTSGVAAHDVVLDDDASRVGLRGIAARVVQDVHAEVMVPSEGVPGNHDVVRVLTRRPARSLVRSRRPRPRAEAASMQGGSRSMIIFRFLTDRPPPSPDQVVKLLHGLNAIPTGGSNVIVRRDALEETNGFDSRLTNGED